MKTLKSKKIMIPVVALVGILVVALIGLSQKTVDVFINVSDNKINSYSNNSSTTSNSNERKTQVASSGSYTYYDNFDEADKNSDLIIVGKVVKVNAPEEIVIGTFTSDIYTVSEFRVDKVIKGDVRVGDIVKVKQIGGAYKGIERTEDGIEFFRLGESHILFLESFARTPCSPINPGQGNMKIVDGKTKKTNNFQFINDKIPEDEFVKAAKEKAEQNKIKREQEKEKNKETK
jgi:hypothetical protein